MREFNEVCRAIQMELRPRDIASEAAMRARWDACAHPIGSLGLLEELTIRIAGMRRTTDVRLDRRALVVMASDNGILEEGVSSGYPSLTAELVASMARRRTGAATLCADANTDVVLVDMGTRFEYRGEGVRSERIAPETKNFRREPAMGKEEMERAIMTGIQIASELADSGCDIIGTGELGIGNTTTASAVMAGLMRLSAEETCGWGAGLDDAGLSRKRRVVEEAIETYALHDAEPLEILRCVGGFDIAGMCGVFIGGAHHGIPVMIDGFISAVAALCAESIIPGVRAYMLASHISGEAQMQRILDALGLDAFLHLKMRLGEGSGCPIAFKVLDSALYALGHMATFSEASIRDDALVNIRERVQEKGKRTC